MRHILILLPLLACLVLGVPALADEPAPDTKAAVEEALQTKVNIAFEDIHIQRAVAYIAEITGLDIVLPDDVEGTITVELKGARAGEALKAVARASGLEMKLTKKGVSKVKTHVGSGDPSSAIIAHARRRKSDLVVLGTRGLSSGKSLLLGSVSRKVLNLCKVNCLVVR